MPGKFCELCEMEYGVSRSEVNILPWVAASVALVWVGYVLLLPYLSRGVVFEINRFLGMRGTSVDVFLLAFAASIFAARSGAGVAFRLHRRAFEKCRSGSWKKAKLPRAVARKMC
jgi:hypothetical protein